MRLLYRVFTFIVLCCFAYGSLWSQCEGLSVDLPDTHEPVVNPNINFCVSLEVNPAVTGHPIGANMFVFHTFQGDLSIRVHACGNTLMLMTRPGGGACNAGGPFGSGLDMDGYYSFMDGGGIDPDGGVEVCGGGYGLSGDPCGVNTVNSWAALVAQCGGSPYTLEICFADHAGAFAGFANNIQLIFQGSDICGCMDPDAISFNPFATIPTNTCCYPSCNLIVNVTENISESCGMANGSATVSASAGSGNYNYTWNTDPPQFSATATGLTQGAYVVTVTDQQNQNCTGVANIFIGANPGHTVTEVSNDPSCDGDNGTIQINVTGGAGSYTYSWSHNPGLTANQAFGLAAGAYTVVVTDTQNGCVKDIDIVLNPPVPIDATSTVIQPDCEFPLGNISLDVTGGTGEYVYSWSHNPGLNNSEASDLEPGFYQVIVTDAGNHCTAIIEVEIEETIALELTVDITETTCNESNGAFQLFITGGIGPYSVSWFGPIFGIGETGFDLPGGIYSLEVFDNGSGCSEILEIEIPDSDPLFIDAFLQHTRCGDENGLISITPLNGSGIYEYTWLSGELINGPDGTDLPPGEYTIQIEDLVTECIAIETVWIEESEPLEVQMIISPADCGFINGSIILNPVNGSGEYFYFWTSGGGNTNSLIDIPGGVYGVTVVDVQTSCEFIDQILVPSSESFEVDVVKVATTCGLANGSIEIIPLTGSGNFEFEWSHDPDQSGSFSGDLMGGVTYMVTITDVEDGCSFILSEAMPLSPALTVQAEIQPLQCTSDDASIVLIPQVGSGDYTYQWAAFPGENSSTIDGLSAGIYQVTVTDVQEGCATNLSVVIEDIVFLQVNCEVVEHESEAGANDGIIVFQSNGGTITHTVIVTQIGSGQVIFSADVQQMESTHIQNLGAGLYEIIIEDENGCQTSCSVVIEPGSCQLSLSLIEHLHPLCHSAEDGVIEVGTTGGVGNIQITWFTDQIIASDVDRLDMLGVGSYQVDAIDELGCTDTIVVVLIAPEPVQITCTPTHESAPDMNDGIVMFQISGVVYPVTIQITGSVDIQNVFTELDAAQFENLPPGEYVTRLVDDNGCVTECSFRINSSNCNLEAVLNRVESVSCFGANDGSIQFEIIDAEGQVEITWSPFIGQIHGNDISNLEPGVYTILFTDELGCQLQLSATINSPEPLTYESLIEDTDCTENTGQIEISVSGGAPPYSIIWSDNDQSFVRTFLGEGEFAFTITDAAGCENSGSYSIRMKDRPEIEIVEIINNTCSGGTEGSVTIATVPDWQSLIITWSHGVFDTPVAQDLPAGSYTVFAMDVNGCRTEAHFNIEEPDSIVVDVTIEAPDCGEDNGSLVLTPSGGTGLYRMISPVVSDDLQLEHLAAGIYEIELVDDAGCTWQESITIPERGAPNANAGEDIYLTCRDNSGTLGIHLDQTNPEITYQWYYQQVGNPIGLNEPVIKVDQPGNYILEVVIITTGCSGLDTLEIQILGEPIAAVSIDWMDPSCFGSTDGTIVIEDIEGGTEPFLLYLNGVEQQSFEVGGLAPGEYFLSIEDEYGCLWPDLIVVLDEPQEYYIQVPSSIVITQNSGESIQAQTNIPMSEISRIRWFTEDSILCDPCESLILENYQPIADHFLWIEITTTNGCILLGRIEIKVLILNKIFIPNAFSPNLDGINDRFFIHGDEQLSLVKSMRIYDRWGNKMFDKSDILPDREDQGWRGDFKGMLVDPGVYVYVFEVQYANGTEDLFYGEVTVMR